jgi:hypothetical protein
MKTMKSVLSVLVLAGAMGSSIASAAGADGVILKDASTEGSYCHMKFPAIDERTLARNVRFSWILATVTSSTSTDHAITIRWARMKSTRSYFSFSIVGLVTIWTNAFASVKGERGKTSPRGNI